MQSLTLLLDDLLKKDDNSSLEFLEYDDFYDQMAWTPFPSAPERTIHHLVGEIYPKFEVGGHWSTSESLWDQYPYSTILKVHNNKDGTVAPWPKPELLFKPVLTIQQKLDFLNRKQAYDRWLDTRTAHVTLTAKKYEPLELDVLLLTTIADLASMFCRARGIDIEISQDTVSVVCLILCKGINRTKRHRIPHTSNIFCFPYEHRIAFDSSDTKLDLDIAG